MEGFREHLTAFARTRCAAAYGCRRVLPHTSKIQPERHGRRLDGPPRSRLCGVFLILLATRPRG